jgi:peptidoglycan/xylan/chitin deacetylase (PgdA/CDA1 family)
VAFSSDTVLVYHSIGRVRRNAPEYNGFVTRERFSAQMRYLAEHRSVVPLGQLVDATNGPHGRVAITFDDGYRSTLKHAVPVLRALGLPATFFVPTKWIGAARGWRARGTAALELMSADELVELDRSGFPVESHGAAHIDYSVSSTDDIAADLEATVESLTTLLGRRPCFHAYPYGRTGREAAALVERAGFRAAFVLDRPQPVTGAFALPRVPVVPADVRPLFALKSAGRYAGLRHSAPVRHAYRAVRPLVRNRWLWP